MLNKIPSMTLAEFEAQQKLQSKLIAKADQSTAFPHRLRAIELAISAGGSVGQPDKLIAGAEAIYQWLRNGPAKMDGD